MGSRRVILFGAQASDLSTEVDRFDTLECVEEHPDIVISFGGDGTLLSAEQKWPGIPKVPIRNSRRGLRCNPHPPSEVIERLAADALFATHFTKLECMVRLARSDEPPEVVSAMNEINVHMGRINSAVRFRLWLNDIRFRDEPEILGDGFLVSTPFGSTAYFNQMTHGLFHLGLGIAFKYTSQPINHLIVPEETQVRFQITRGPALLAYDNAPDFIELLEEDEILIQKNTHSAIILTCDPIQHPCDIF